MRKPNYPGPRPPKRESLTPHEEVRWFTAREAAEYLRTTVGSVHNMVYRKQLDYFKRLGRLLFRKTDLDRLIVSTS